MDRPRLLLVDDDEKMRMLLQRYLGDQEFSVEGVGTPSAMDRMLEKKPFDLMVLDLMLPEEDGLSICRRLRAAGWRVVFTPAAEVRHELGKSMERTPERARFEYHRSHLRYYRKHNGPLARGALRLLLLARGVGGLASLDPSRRSAARGLVGLALGGD